MGKQTFFFYENYDIILNKLQTKVSCYIFRNKVRNLSFSELKLQNLNGFIVYDLNRYKTT